MDLIDVTWDPYNESNCGSWFDLTDCFEPRLSTVPVCAALLSKVAWSTVAFEQRGSRQRRGSDDDD
eukprot:6464890-Amphidinium_carterae.1